MRLHVPSRPIHFAAFLLLAFLCYQAHQVARHIMGTALCGGPGTMTFTVTVTRQPCHLPVLVTLSGPMLTLALAYAGLHLLRSARAALFGYALVFASFQHLRWIQTLTGRGDELVLAHNWWAEPSRLLVATAVLLVSIPPIWAAFHVINNRRRLRTFILTWLLALPLLFMLLLANRLLFGESGAEIRGPVLAGLPWLVLIVDILAAALFIFLWPRALKEAEA